MGHVGVDENVQAVRLILQDEVRAAANDDARALAGKITDDVRLADVEFIRHGHGIDQTHRVRGDGNIKQEAAGNRGVFTDLLDELMREAAFLGDLIDQFLVIIGDAEPLGHRLTDASSAATKLAADGDDLICHKNSPFILITPLYTKTGALTNINFYVHQQFSRHAVFLQSFTVNPAKQFDLPPGYSFSGCDI